MCRHSLRLLVAMLTFTIGIGIVRVIQLIPQLETALVDRIFIESDQIPATPVICDSAADANEIYRVIVQRFILTSEVKLIVLRAETTGFPYFEDESLRKERNRAETFHQIVKELMPEAEQQTLDNYLANNKSSERLKVSNLGINHVIVNESDLPSGKFDSFWDRFYKKYPNSPGLIFFSNVGFNEQHDQAFVYAGIGCGGLCGRGEYVLLTKVNGKWQILKARGLWVS